MASLRQRISKYLILANFTKIEEHVNTLLGPLGMGLSK